MAELSESDAGENTTHAVAQAEVTAAQWITALIADRTALADAAEGVFHSMKTLKKTCKQNTQHTCKDAIHMAEFLFRVLILFFHRRLTHTFAQRCLMLQQHVLRRLRRASGDQLCHQLQTVCCADAELC